MFVFLTRGEEVSVFWYNMNQTGVVNMLERACVCVLAGFESVHLCFRDRGHYVKTRFQQDLNVLVFIEMVKIPVKHFLFLSL